MHRRKGTGGAPKGDEVARARRVLLLLAIVVVLSLADLFFTVLYLRSTGMIEANPVAAFLIRTTNSWEALLIFKLATVAVCVTLLYRVRRHAEGEFASWGAVAIMVLLTVHWSNYTHDMDAATAMTVAQDARTADVWLTLD